MLIKALLLDIVKGYDLSVTKLILFWCEKYYPTVPCHQGVSSMADRRICIIAWSIASKYEYKINTLIYLFL